MRLVVLVLLSFALLAATPPSTVRIGLREQPNTLSPLLGTQYDENYIDVAIFSGLTVLDDRGRVQPDLASAVPTRANGGVSADGKTLTYHLRPGARWQDGAPVSAADVVFTFARMRDPRVPFPQLSSYEVVERVEARGPLTVVVRLRHPSPDAPAQIFVNGQNGSILPKHLLEHVGDLVHARFNDAPIGSGPYRLERWERGNAITLVANPTYFRGAPAVARIELRFLPDANTRAFQAQTGEVDLAGVPPARARELARAPGLRIVALTQPSLLYLLYRLDAAPFDDVRVRRAFAAVVDRDAIARKVFLGYAQPADDLELPSSPFHAALPPQAVDPGQARALLAAAGWRSGADGIRSRAGKRLALTLTTAAGSTVAAQTAVLLQAAWKAIGAEVDVRPLPTNLLYAPAGTLARGDFNVALTPYAFDVTPDRSTVLVSSAIPPAGSNYSRLRDRDVDRWMAQARAGDDMPRRRALYHAIAQRVREVAPIVPIVWTKAVYAVSNRVDGIRPEPVNSDLWNVVDWRLRH